MKTRNKKRLKVVKYQCTLIGGPWAGKVLFLSTPATAVFKVQGWHGRYANETLTSAMGEKPTYAIQWESRA